MKTNKYRYAIILQGKFGSSWEDIASYGSRESAQAEEDLDGWRNSGWNCEFRTINRRIANSLVY